MLDGIKNIIIGKTRAEELSPYARALNEASAQRNTAVAQRDYARNYLETHQDIDQNSNLYSTLSKIASDEYTKPFEENLSQYQGIWDKAKKQQEWNMAGSGLLGSMINSGVQSGSALNDLYRTGTQKWKSGKRDVWSDVGAGIETGLNLAGLISGAGAFSSAAKTAAPTLGKTILKGAGTGALYGGAGTLGNYLQTAGSESNLEDAALMAAIGAGTGGLLGGGVGAAGYGMGNLRSKALAGNQKVAEAAATAQKAQSDVAAYQNAMKAAQELGLDTSSNEALKNSYRAWSLANHPDKAGNVVALLPSSTATSGSMTAQEAQNLVNAINQNAVQAATAAQGAAGNAYNTLYNTNLADLLATSKSAQSALKKASNQAMLDYLGNTKLGRLGSTKLGKAAAVGGTAYGISRLLGNRNGGNNE